MSGKIIVNHEVLLPDYLLPRLLFRDTEYQELLTSVKNRVSVLLVGPVGSGKTSLVKLLQRELGADAVAYVDCLIHGTEYAVLKEIVPSVRAAFLRSNFELIEELRRVSQETRMIICFDNFVRLKDLSVIDRVMALGITTVLVSSVERDLHLLGHNSTSKLARIIKLKNYSNEESYRILKARIEHGLARGSFNDDILKSIVNSTNGNIAFGVSVLRTAALKAESDGRNKIDPNDLQNLLPEHREDLELTEDERVIMGILREKRSVEHKHMYNLYCQSTTSPKQERTFRNYLQRLIAKSLVRIDFSDGDKLYQVIENR